MTKFKISHIKDQNVYCLEIVRTVGMKIAEEDTQKFFFSEESFQQLVEQVQEVRDAV